MFIEEFVVTPFQQNARIVACEETGVAICIDPGAEADRIAESLDRHGFSLQAIALTHAHLDHICGVADLKRIKPNATIILHAFDEPLYQGLPQQGASVGLSAEMLRSLGLNCEVPPLVEQYWTDGESYEVGRLSFRVSHVPGHSPGHVLLYEPREQKLIAGDCIFAGSIGRTDLPGGSFEALMSSI
ncbi:MAG: MBL fold metallo-hydrolase, partial [Pyrinomonadaceae bacterium]